MDWAKVLKFAQKQALVGVMFEGIQRLPKELSPKGATLMVWIAQTQMIERQSRKLNAATAAVYRRLKELGAESCILKGQGNALLYQNPLSRTPGDVDVWLAPKMDILKDGRIEIVEDEKAHRKTLRAMAVGLTREHGTIGHESYNHIEVTVDSLPVELHPTPAVLNYPLHNRRLQRWLMQEAPAQCKNMVELPDKNGQIAVPTVGFNLVYQLLHLYHHHLFEGIGLRQFVDYVLLMKERATLSNPFLVETLHKLGIYNFAGAVMYVLQEVFGLSEEQLLVPADKKRGELLLADILHGGNFGHYDNTFAKNALGHNLQRICRDLRLMRYYPTETLSEPFFRLWHWVWRKRQRT